MTVSSRAAVIEALASGRPEELLDTAENVWLDFKSAPYALQSGDKAKFELCKDVAAFANAQGGLLVLGAKASKRSDKAMEVATDLQPFPQARADVDRYIDTLNDCLRPRVAITHRWYEDRSRCTGQVTSCYYLVIEVKAVPEPDRYVIVRRTLNDKGMFADGLAVPVRHGDRTVYLPSEDVYRLINEGLCSRDALSMVSAAPVQELQGAADQSLDTLQRLQDWDDEPVLMWQSIPPHPIQILPGLHSDDGVRGALRDQDVLRPCGLQFFRQHRPPAHPRGGCCRQSVPTGCVDPPGRSDDGGCDRHPG
ncbi:MAG TPA: ATP-binding protein, partial [Nonomuraea sp.]|nr:ATP-binding protein [Nonomuraea sp.]